MAHVTCTSSVAAALWRTITKPLHLRCRRIFFTTCWAPELRYTLLRFLRNVGGAEHMKSCSLILALALVAAGGACSGSKTSPPAGAFANVATTASAAAPSRPVSNPCSLTNPAEVSAVMGRKSGPGEFHKDLGGRCNFYDSTSQYEIFLQTIDTATFDSLTHLPGNTKVSGIGDRALWSDGSLYVQKGDRALQIGFSLPHPLKTMTPAAEKLAKLIVSRM